MPEDVPGEVVEAVRKEAPEGRMTCERAHALAAELGVPVPMVGRALDLLDLHGAGCADHGNQRKNQDHRRSASLRPIDGFFVASGFYRGNAGYDNCGSDGAWKSERNGIAIYLRVRQFEMEDGCEHAGQKTGDGISQECTDDFCHESEREHLALVFLFARHEKGKTRNNKKGCATAENRRSGEEQCRSHCRLERSCGNRHGETRTHRPYSRGHDVSYRQALSGNPRGEGERRKAQRSSSVYETDNARLHAEPEEVEIEQHLQKTCVGEEQEEVADEVLPYIRFECLERREIS